MEYKSVLFNLKAFKNNTLANQWKETSLSNTKPPKNILQQLLHPDLAGDLPHGLQRPLDVLRWQEAKNML